MKKVKFGHINIDNVFDLLPEINKIKEEIADFAKSMENQLIELQNEIEKKEEEIYNFRRSISKKKKEQAENELISLKNRVTNFQQNTITLLKEKEVSVLEPFFVKIKETIKIIGEEKKLIYVFDSNSLLFISNESIDITPDVISILKLTDNKQAEEFLN